MYKSLKKILNQEKTNLKPKKGLLKKNNNNPKSSLRATKNHTKDP